MASNFNGYIYAVKYYKTSVPPVNGIHSMEYKIEITNALLYFIFTSIGLANDLSF